MAGKEISSVFADQEVRFPNEKRKQFSTLNRQLTRRSAAIALTSALYLAVDSVHQNNALAQTPTPTVEQPTIPPSTPTRLDQQPWQAISALGSVATAGALLMLWRQARATEKTAKATENAVRTAENTAKATKEIVEATNDATKAAVEATYNSIYENLMTRGDAINATFLEHPELYNQLFDKPHVGPESIKRTSNQRKDTQVLAAALRFADFFEISLNLKRAMPKDAQDSWERYMKTSLKNSETLRNLIRNTPWYGEKIKQFNIEVEQEMEREAAASAQQEHRFQRIRRLVQPILNTLRKR